MEEVNSDQPKIVESIFSGKFLICSLKLRKLGFQKHLKAEKNVD